MQLLNAKDAKYGFGRLIDMARAEPVAVAKRGRPVEFGYANSRPSTTKKAK